MDEHDLVIVGGGAAGCVLAARLSEDGRRRVTLIEAGRDTPPGAVPEDILDLYPVSYSNPAYFWPRLTASARPASAAVPFPQARVMGGGSSVMGMWALRGMPGDYDAWAAQGAAGWSWAEVLPAFKRLEHDLDRADALHGGDGPVPIARHPVERWPAYARALLSAAERRGLPFHDDLNGIVDDGVYATPLTVRHKARVSAAAAYLTVDVRRRPNLRILAETEAGRILLDGRRATGIEVTRSGEKQVLRCREIILSAGAIFSPALLLRSGIGPSADLARAGVEPRLDLPGVGRNLQNHCVVSIASWLHPSARQTRALRTYGLGLIRLSSRLPDAPEGDLHLQIVGKTGAYAHGDMIGVFGAALQAPLSRGSVTLRASDADLPPEVRFNLFDHPSDRARLKVGIALALQLLGDREVQALRGEAFVARPTSLVRRLNRPGLGNAITARVLARALDGPAWLRRCLLAGSGSAVEWGKDVEAAADVLVDLATPVFHPAGSCRMGRPDDPDAVVDPCCRVRGLAGFRVVDASIMPVIPRGNTCVPTIMVAERAAELIRSDPGQ